MGEHGLTVTGSGQLEAATAAASPGGTYEVVQHDTGAVVETEADDEGRLRFSVDLGASHTLQQVRFDDLATVGWSRATVTITQT